MVIYELQRKNKSRQIFGGRQSSPPPYRPYAKFTKIVLKWYYDQKIISFFSSDFESVFDKHPTGKILSFVFYPKAVYFKCKFWISRSAITHVQN